MYNKSSNWEFQMTNIQTTKTRRVLESVKNKHYNKPVTGFVLQKGSNYNNELMVVGRAVNGWLKDEIKCDCFNDSNKVDEYIKILNGDSENGCHLAWVVDIWNNPSPGTRYITRRSAFWRIVKKVTLSLKIPIQNDERWSSYLIWSNLYKVSPHKAGNPTKSLINAQQNSCIELLKAEIEVNKPKRVLMMTGSLWAQPFVDHLNGKPTKIDDNEIIKSNFFYTHEDGFQTQIVVVDHPQGKPESVMVEKIVAAQNVK